MTFLTGNSNFLELFFNFLYSPITSSSHSIDLRVEVIFRMSLSPHDENEWAWIEDLQRGETISGGGLVEKAPGKPVFA
jgi:hypothetical protein